MKFLCLAYGSEEDWKDLSKSEQDELLAQDAVLRKAGALMAAVMPSVTCVKAWEGTPETAHTPFAAAPVPLAGFSIIEADNIEDVVQLVASTPCARAGGAIEIRPIRQMNDFVLTTPES